MDIGGLGNKILGGVEKNALLIGAGIGFLKSYGGFENSLQYLLGFNYPHGPDMQHLARVFRDDSTYRTAIIAIIGGYLAQESGIAIVDRGGKILITAASAFLAVRVAEALLWSMTHSVGAGGGIGTASKLIGN